DEQGKFIMSRSTLFDITDRKRVEDALRESETRYRLLAENITDLVIRLDPAANYTYVSPSSRRLLGYEPEEMVGRSGFDFIHPDDRPVIQDASIRAITERQPYSPLAVRFIHKEGRYVWMEISGQSVFSEETGEVMEFITISRNIDAERAAQHALRESEERLRILFESVPDAIFLLTHDGMLSDVNPAAVTLCGMPREDILGKHFMDLNLIDPTWHGFSENAVLNISSTAPESMEFELLHPDGDRRMIEVLVHPVTLRGQGYNLAIARDMTLRKRYEESLKNALQKERDLSQLKSRFLSIASHEFRNPLAVIMTSADLLVHYRHKMAESDITDRLIKIQQQVNHLKAIMEDVLELEGLEQGRIRYNPAEGDLDVLCREILDEFRTSPGQTHQLVYTGPDWPKFTTFDPRLMRQVITNLISNAIKYSPKAQSVWVQLEYQDTQAMLQVRDEGIGIPPEELSHLFEAFHRAANVGKIPGSGLGLSIVKQSVDLHNGGVSVESQINAGTVFTVTLPV
ncbi:MAG: PAS domain-containing sensor histidine kinase, partial [Anaerolineae bacterium]|nr:PAS domain-containing sensor histidine kinase [Anaerolineae bacterium]